MGKLPAESDRARAASALRRRSLDSSMKPSFMSDDSESEPESAADDVRVAIPTSRTLRTCLNRAMPRFRGPPRWSLHPDPAMSPLVAEFRSLRRVSVRAHGAHVGAHGSVIRSQLCTQAMRLRTEIPMPPAVRGIHIRMVIRPLPRPGRGGRRRGSDLRARGGDARPRPP